VCTGIDVVGLHPELPRVQGVQRLEELPADMPLKPGASRLGTDATAAIACLIPTPSTPDEAPEVISQMQRTEAVRQQLESHPLHQLGEPTALLKRHRRAAALQEEIEKCQDRLLEQSQRHWEEFIDLIKILQHFGGLEDLTPTPLGEAAAAIRGDNELWLGLALRSGEFNELDPHHLAAACAALVTEVSRPDSWAGYDLSPEVEGALENLRSVRRALFQLQRRHRVALPVWLEVDLISLVEQWALGVEWVDLCENTSLDEGDVVRILRRTLDFLSQIPHVPNISESLKINAYRAMQLIDRFPVNEVLD
jgi:superfamily II RNA helicase